MFAFLNNINNHRSLYGLVEAGCNVHVLAAFVFSVMALGVVLGLRIRSTTGGLLTHIGYMLCLIAFPIFHSAIKYGQPLVALSATLVLVFVVGLSLPFLFRRALADAKLSDGLTRPASN